MTAFVQGVPETSRIWDAVRALLHSNGPHDTDHGDAVAVSLPGFGGPRPAGFARPRTHPALEIGVAHDETTSRCILDLYRSAVPNVDADWCAEAHRPTRAPGLVLLQLDPLEEAAMNLGVAEMLGARTASLGDLEHCWMAQDPETTVSVLRRFWSSVN